MLAAGYDISTNTDPWRFQLHLEIWVLIVALIVGYVYAGALATFKFFLQKG